MRRIAKTKKIELSEPQYRVWYDKLSEFFKAKKTIDSNDIPDKIKEILAEAQEGWPRAPKKIETRIKMKSGYQWKSHNNLRANPETLPNVIRYEAKAQKTIKEMFSIEKNLSEEELVWWNRRDYHYREEFEFNQSSDEPLIFQLLVEELTQRRIANLILSNPKEADGYSRVMTESLKRLQDTQVKLGITREQRADLLENKSGDVSSLSIDLEEKMRRAKDKIAQWEVEQQKQRFLQDQEGPLNLLPEDSKLEALLGIGPDGDVLKALDTEGMDQLMQEAERIHDEAQKEESEAGGSEAANEEEEETNEEEEEVAPGRIIPREDPIGETDEEGTV